LHVSSVMSCIEVFRRHGVRKVARAKALLWETDIRIAKYIILTLYLSINLHLIIVTLRLILDDSVTFADITLISTSRCTIRHQRRVYAESIVRVIQTKLTVT
jgi:hypothetical protein